jgi:tyrosyl-tRNA synthetase
MDVKMRLGEEIISGFHTPEQGRKAAESFQRVFRERQLPDDIPEAHVPAGAHKLFALLTQNNLAPSRNEAERLIRANAVEWDGGVVNQLATLQLAGGEKHLLRVGKKKFLRLVVD